MHGRFSRPATTKVATWGLCDIRMRTTQRDTHTQDTTVILLLLLLLLLLIIIIINTINIIIIMIMIIIILILQIITAMQIMPIHINNTILA